jgi:glyoxylase-like metal-dependent hydrolase (beta-lactamase superfamily II)
MKLINPRRVLLPCAALMLLLLSAGCDDSASTSKAGFNPDGTQRANRASGAEVITFDFGDMTLHDYVDTPANGVGNSTYVIEGPTSLVLIDSQFLEDSAKDFRAYVDSLGKPIDRMLLTHGHQDHVRGIAAAFGDVTTYSSQGVIAEALADSGSVIAQVLGASATIDGIRYTFEVRANLEASEQVIIRLPDYGVVALGDVLYNGWHAVMNPGFDGWIAALDTFAAEEGINLFLAGHGEAGDAAAVQAASAYLTVAKDAFATAADGDAFKAAMLAAYPDLPGPFLLQLSIDQILYPSPFNPDGTQRATRDSGAEVITFDFGDMTLHNYVDAPANGVGNSTYVIEGPTSLVLIDSQFFEDSAKDFRAYVDSIGKPIDRMLLTHGHQDHVRGIAAAFDDVTTYSSQGVIAEALADSGSVIAEVLGDSATVDGISYTFEVRTNLEASEQVVIRLPDYGVVGLGDVFYNGWHAVMNPGFDGWIAALDTAAAEPGVNLFLAGHGEAGDAAAVQAASAYLTVAKDAFATAADGDAFKAAMLAAYPDLPGAFLLQLSIDQILYPAPSFAVDFGACDELAMGSVVPLAELQAKVPAGVTVLSLTATGTVFEGSDNLGVLITRVLSCESITVDGTTETDVHLAHVGTPVDVTPLPATPYNTDGNNGADFNNYTFSYVTDSTGFLGALTGAGVAGAGSATFSFVDTAAGACTVSRQVDVVGGDYGFSASGTLPDASCEATDVPFVANWWSVTDGDVAVLSNNIPGQAALFLDLDSTPVTLDPADGSSLAGFLGDDSVAIDAFGLVGHLPEADGVDMVVTVAGSLE